MLTAIANHTHPDGTGAWAKIATLAHEARLSEREVQYAQIELKKIGELGIEYGAGPYGTNLYHLPKMMAMLGANSAPMAQEGCTGALFGVHTGPPEPLKTEPIKSKRKRACSWPEGFALTEEMFAYAVKRGVPQPEEEFEKFRNWCQREDAVYIDWPAAWRTRADNYSRFNRGVSNGTRQPNATGASGGKLDRFEQAAKNVTGRGSGLAEALRGDAVDGRAENQLGRNHPVLQRLPGNTTQSSGPTSSVAVVPRPPGFPATTEGTARTVRDGGGKDDRSGKPAA